MNSRNPHTYRRLSFKHRLLTPKKRTMAAGSVSDKINPQECKLNYKGLSN